MKVILAADHRGFALKEELKTLLKEDGHIVEDVGAHTLVPDDDYPNYAYAAARAVALGEEVRGILLCGSGMGMDIVANKVKGIRATLVVNPEAARYAREHDDVNIVTIAADEAVAASVHEIVTAFLSTDFAGGRHARRLEEIAQIEAENFK